MVHPLHSNVCEIAWTDIVAPFGTRSPPGRTKSAHIKDWRKVTGLRSGSGSGTIGWLVPVARESEGCRVGARRPWEQSSSPDPRGALPLYSIDHRLRCEMGIGVRLKKNATKKGPGAATPDTSIVAHRT